MRSLVLLLAVLALGGCMTVSDMAEGTRYHMSDAGLLDHSDSRRVNNFRIQPDSFIYIAQGAFAPPGGSYPRPNVVAEEAFKGFVEYFPMVRRARAPEGLEQAMGEARVGGGGGIGPGGIAGDRGDECGRGRKREIRRYRTWHPLRHRS